MSQPLVVVQEDPIFVVCPNCVFDSINKKSSNVFDASFTSPVTIFQGTDQERTLTPTTFSLGRCPVCIGEGQLFTATELCIPALVNYRVLSSDKEKGYLDYPAGKEGESAIQIKTLYCFYEILRANSVFVVYGNVKTEKIMPPLVRGLGSDQAVCEMWLQTTEVGESATGDINTHEGRNIDPRRRIKGPSDLQILRGLVKGK